MPDISTIRDLIRFAKEKREILHNYKTVDCFSDDADSKLLHPSDVSDEIDLCVNQQGSKIIEDIRREIYKFEDSYFNENLLNLYGSNHIDNEIYSFLRKKKYKRNVIKDLVQPKKHKWNVFLGLINIHITKTLDLKAAALYPPGLPNIKNLSSTTRSSLMSIDKTPFIEIRNLEAPTLFYAGIKAIGLARSYLAFTPNRFSSFSHKDDIRFSGYIIGYNRSTRRWRNEWNLPHKGLVISDYEQAVLKKMGELLSKAAKKKTGLSTRALDISEMFFAAKATQYAPAKLLLLTTVLESLLLESTFNQGPLYKKINDHADKVGNPRLKVKKGTFFSKRLKSFTKENFNIKNQNTRKALKFLDELYSKRSEVTHLCQKHKLSDDQVSIVETICFSLLSKIFSSRANSHLGALKAIGAVDGKV